MEGKTGKRVIGVIPPHEQRNRRYLDEFRKAVLPAWSIIPDTLFYKTSFEKVAGLARGGFAYDLLVAARMKDERDVEAFNLYRTALAMKSGPGRDSVILVSFNGFITKMMGLNFETEKGYLDRISDHMATSTKPNLSGIVLTSSTDPAFLLSIISDILDDPSAYLAQKEVYGIENQSHFINHPPGQTRIGIRQ